MGWRASRFRNRSRQLSLLSIWPLHCRANMQTKDVQSKTHMKILFVDDSETDLLLFSYALKADHDVTAISNPLEAFELLKASTFDLAIIDYMMQPIDGFELIRKIRCELNDHDLWIIVLSGYKDVVDKYAEAGADDFMEKPIDALESVTVRVRVAEEAIRHRVQK